MRTAAAASLLALVPWLVTAHERGAPWEHAPWAVEHDDPGEAPRGGWRLCLWLPGPEGYTDATGNANALIRSHQASAFVTLYTTLAAEAEGRLDPAAAWLETPAGRAEPLRDPRLGHLQPGRSVSGDGPGASVSVTLGFPPLDPGWERLTLHVPWAGEPGELVVRLFHWRGRLAELERDLEEWRRHTELPEVRLRSSLAPWVTCDAAAALRARGERFTVPLLLRELSRGEAGLRALPRFVVLHELAATRYGRQHEVPAAGDARVAREVLRRWRERGGPTLPGVGPRDEAY